MLCVHFTEALERAKTDAMARVKETEKRLEEERLKVGSFGAKYSLLEVLVVFYGK